MTNSAPLVSIVIVNWNGRNWLETCLPTLYAQTMQDFETIVVDNASEDGSVAWLREQWPQVIVLPQRENTGFARGNNIGMTAANGRFIVTLNNDTLLEPDWLEHLVAGVDAPDVGMVACKMLLWHTPELLDSVGIEMDKAGIAWNRGWQEPEEMHTAVIDIFGPCGGAALYTKAMLDDVGLFDETFFAYYEDSDLAWRGQRAGWRCRLAPHAKLRHWHSATSSKNMAFKQFLLCKNKWLTIHKNYPRPQVWRNLPLILIYDFMSIALQLFKTRSLAPLRGRLAAARQIWRMERENGRDRSVELVGVKRPF